MHHPLKDAISQKSSFYSRVKQTFPKGIEEKVLLVCCFLSSAPQLSKGLCFAAFRPSTACSAVSEAESQDGLPALHIHQSPVE